MAGSCTRACSTSTRVIDMLLAINPDNPQERLIAKVVEVLESGGIIAYPTDTTYGIGCSIFNKKGIERMLHDQKTRPVWRVELAQPGFALIATSGVKIEELMHIH